MVYSQRIILTALIMGDQEIKTQILGKISAEYFHEHLLSLIFLWASEELKSGDSIDEAELYQQMESYVYDHWVSASDPEFDGSEYSAEEVLPGYLAVVDHVLAIEMPDDETVNHAIASLQKYYERRARTSRDASCTSPTAHGG